MLTGKQPGKVDDGPRTAVRDTSPPSQKVKAEADKGAAANPDR